MLVLVLDHHAVDEAVREEGDVLVEDDLVKVVEHPAAHALEIGERLSQLEERQLPAGAPGLGEGVVEEVQLGVGEPLAPQRGQEPLLLVVGHVRQVPDERGHERRVLAGERGTVQAFEQPQRSLPAQAQGLGDGVLQLPEGPLSCCCPASAHPWASVTSEGRVGSLRPKIEESVINLPLAGPPGRVDSTPLELRFGPVRQER
jgi:hypothetical protein